MPWPRSAKRRRTGARGGSHECRSASRHLHYFCCRHRLCAHCDSFCVVGGVAMTGKNRIMIYGPKNDGTYIIEFKTAAGEALAISVPAGETRVLKYFQERMPLWAVRAGHSVRNLWRAITSSYSTKV